MSAVQNNVCPGGNQPGKESEASAEDYDFDYLGHALPTPTSLELLLL